MEYLADPFHSMDNLRNQSASVASFRSSIVYSVRNGDVTEWPVVVLTYRFPRH